MFVVGQVSSKNTSRAKAGNCLGPGPASLRYVGPVLPCGPEPHFFERQPEPDEHLRH